MEDKVVPSNEQLKQELEKLPPAVSTEMLSAWDALSSDLDDGQLAAWAQTGVEMAVQTVRSWEAASQYFKASPKVAGLMPFNYFVKWSECGQELCRESPALATSYFEASPATMGRLRSRHIETWAALGRRLYKGTWKSGMLSSKFFEASPALLKLLTLHELEGFVSFLDSVSGRSYDLATECLAFGQRVFPMLGDQKEGFISLAASVLETDWRQVKSFFEAAIRSLPRVETGQRLRFLALVQRVLSSGFANVPAVMEEVSRSVAEVGEDDHERLFELAERLLGVSPSAVPDFIKSCPQALERVTLSQMEKWFEEGMQVLQRNGDGGLAYFKLESAHSHEVLDALSSSVEFTRIKNILELYCRALAGSDVDVAATEELVEKNIGWVSNEAPTTEGTTVFVPSQVDRYPEKEENFSLYKVVCTHQVSHLEFGSFSFEFDRPATLFRDVRPLLERKRSSADDVGPSDADDAPDRAWGTDMHRFFDLFEDRSLALDIFAVVEDGRLDARVKAEYPGMRRAYVRVQHDSLQGRPEVRSLPVREAMVEFLVRVSLQQYKGLSAPAKYAAEARKVARIATRVLHTEAAVEDAAEATLRIYAILAQMPNEALPPDEWQDIDVPEDEEDLEGDLDELVQSIGAGSEGDAEQAYQTSANVEYRGDFKPELVQLLARLRAQSEEQNSDQGAQPVSQELLEELLRNSAEMDLEAADGGPNKLGNAFVDNLLKEAGLDVPSGPEFGQGPPFHVGEDGGPLDPNEPQTFVYDEWDFRADDYRPRWCIVRQKNMAEGDPSFYAATLQSHQALVEQIRRQFEMMVPEMFRKVRKLEDGEEIDIDEVIEAFIDIRAGVGPSEKLFWRRNKVQRDVAVGFLLDTSASTAEAIDESRRVPEDWEAPDDPVEYMAWLRARRDHGMRRSYTRIIDIEKEAVVLLIDALEAIGDTYGIYGFSGYGRENVEFYTIKDIAEEFSERVKRRIDRIAPLHATRMGPAIRHVTSKLETEEAHTKLLFLISDGRPQDRGYSREGVEKEYAVHDTKMALDEARDKDITTFCLTVDKSGHDYLKTMCQDIGYEVLDDIQMLPQRLLYLYKRLTM